MCDECREFLREMAREAVKTPARFEVKLACPRCGGSSLTKQEQRPGAWSFVALVVAGFVAVRVFKEFVS